MRIKLKYIGIVANKLGISNDELVLQESITIKELLNLLVKTYKLKNKEPFFIDYKNKSELSVFVMRNQKLATPDEKIKDNDTLVVLPIIAGG